MRSVSINIEESAPSNATTAANSAATSSDTTNNDNVNTELSADDVTDNVNNNSGVVNDGGSTQNTRPTIDASELTDQIDVAHVAGVLNDTMSRAMTHLGDSNGEGGSPTVNMNALLGVLESALPGSTAAYRAETNEDHNTPTRRVVVDGIEDDAESESDDNHSLFTMPVAPPLNMMEDDDDDDEDDDDDDGDDDDDDFIDDAFWD